MYRCYNGMTYAKGRSQAGTKGKIHPNDIVRCELDMTAGTLRFIINGDDQGVVFSNLEGEIYPAVCFYGSNRAVRLIKLEQLGGGGGFGKWYLPSDDFKRKRWLGPMEEGSDVRHGEGKLTYTSSNGYWYGNWVADKQEGLHAWVEVD